nr:hypothetical protein CFP56_78124 [Quercus suber]
MWIGSQISGRTWRHMDRQPNFRLCMEACEIKDGGWLLGFYISEANEENHGIGFVVARVGEDGVQTLGFCISEAKEKICGIGFAKLLRKNNKSEGKLELDDATTVAFDSGEVVAKRPCGGSEGSSSLG